MIDYLSKHKKHIAIGAGILLLMTGVAAGSAYITKESLSELENYPELSQRNQDHQATGTRTARKSMPHEQQWASAQITSLCDDGNVAGYVAGGIAGGVLGNQIGKGHGNTAATIGGTLGGAYLGGQYMPTHNITCRQ
jgi:uncharacterized protein YcfJ